MVTLGANALCTTLRRDEERSAGADGSRVVGSRFMQAAAASPVSGPLAPAEPWDRQQCGGSGGRKQAAVNQWQQHNRTADHPTRPTFSSSVSWMGGIPAAAILASPKAEINAREEEEGGGPRRLV